MKWIMWGMASGPYEISPGRIMPIFFLYVYPKRKYRHKAITYSSYPEEEAWAQIYDILAFSR